MNTVDKNVTEEQIYYNISIGGNGTSPTLAKFDVNRVDKILTNPSDWVINVESFTIPLFSIPLFQFFKTGPFFITLEYNGSSVAKELVYIPSGVGFAPVSSGPVYSYQNFIQTYNIAFRDAFADLLVLQPLIPATRAPFITLNGNLLSINCEAAYESNLPNPINIFMNKFSAQQFTNLPQFFETPDRIQFLIVNQYNNFNGGFFKMTQSIEGISTWSSLNRILLETNTIPVDKQLVGSQNDIQSQVIEDFIVLPDPNRPLDLIFKPVGPIRINTLTSNYPLSSIDVSIRWFSDEGESQIIILPANKQASIKLRFTKRDILNERFVDNSAVNQI